MFFRNEYECETRVAIDVNFVLILLLWTKILFVAAAVGSIMFRYDKVGGSLAWRDVACGGYVAARPLQTY